MDIATPIKAAARGDLSAKIVIAAWLKITPITITAPSPQNHFVWAFSSACKTKSVVGSVYDTPRTTFLIVIVGNVLIVSTGTKKARVNKPKVLSCSMTQDNSGRGSTTGVTSSRPLSVSSVREVRFVSPGAGMTAAALSC
jgi:hypothetical protein